MKKILPLCLIALALTACSSTPKAPVAEQPAATAPATPAAAPVVEAAKAVVDSPLVAAGKQLAQACSASSNKDVCNASDQIAAVVNQTTAANSSAPSFNCAKASTDVEKAVCSNKTLGTLDAITAKLYKAAGPSAKADQKTWMNERNACQDAQCVAVKYAERILTLGSR
jgi:hypothetical protein